MRAWNRLNISMIIFCSSSSIWSNFVPHSLLVCFPGHHRITLTYISSRRKSLVSCTHSFFFMQILFIKGREWEGPCFCPVPRFDSWVVCACSSCSIHDNCFGPFFFTDIGNIFRRPRGDSHQHVGGGEAYIIYLGTYALKEFFCVK